MSSVQNGQKKNSDWFSWALIVFFFAIEAWPIALVMLFFKLFGGDEKKKQQQIPPLEVKTKIPYRQEPTQTAPPRQEPAAKGAKTQPRRAAEAARKVTRSPVMKSSTAKTLKLVGIILAAMGLYLSADPASMVFYGYGWYWVWETLKYLALAVGGAGMLGAGLSMDKAMRRYARYLAVIGEREAAPFEQLSRQLGYPEKRVTKDLQKMIERGYFGGEAYLNMELGYFFRSSKADESFARQRQAQQTQAAPPPKEAEEGYSGILRNIRRANDRIADPALSEKISRLESITAKIFRAVEEDPQKRSRIDTFLNYYLPTTQKLLDSYAEFESTGIEGENLRQAKARIEKTMDSIIAGFEHQLDELYRSDVMDVDSDIRVMETMLHRDTASVERDFGLGKKTAPAAPQPAAPARTAEVDLGGAAAQRQETAE